MGRRPQLWDWIERDSEGSAGFDPASVTSAILNAGSVSTVVTGLGISSLADDKGGSPAVQSTDGERPPRGTGNIITWVADDLEWPMQSGVNNHATAFSLGLWMRSPLSTVAREILFVRTTPATANRVKIEIGTDESTLVDVYHSDAVARRGRTAASQVGDNVWEFWTFEIDLTQGTEAAQLVITKNTTPLVLTFSNSLGSPGAMPAALVQPTGSGLLGAGTNLGTTSPFTGDWGPKIYIAERQWTLTERTNLMNHLVPA